MIYVMYFGSQYMKSVYYLFDDRNYLVEQLELDLVKTRAAGNTRQQRENSCSNHKNRIDM